MSLEPIAEALSGYEFVNYQRDVDVVVLNDLNVPIGALANESITITGSRQIVQVCDFGDYFVVGYGGDEAQELEATLHGLNLPPLFNSNMDLGEKVFYALKGSVERAETGPCYVQQDLTPGPIDELTAKLQKLCELYSN